MYCTSLSSNCIDGQFTNSSGSDRCQACGVCQPGQEEVPGGVNELGCRECRPCPPGFETPATENGTCAQCFPGYYANSTGTARCSACPPGTSSFENRTGCAICDAGQYSNEKCLFH